MRFVLQLDRFSGCLIRQFLEDALGFPVEGSPPGIYASYVEQFRNIGWAMLEWECELYDKIKGDVRFRKEVEKKAGLRFELPNKQRVFVQNPRYWTECCGFESSASASSAHSSAFVARRGSFPAILVFRGFST